MCGATSCLLVWSSSCLWLTTVLWCHNHWSTEELPGTELLKIFMLFSTSAHNPEEVGNSGQGRHNDFRLTAAFTQSFLFRKWVSSLDWEVFSGSVVKSRVYPHSSFLSVSRSCRCLHLPSKLYQTVQTCLFCSLVCSGSTLSCFAAFLMCLRLS